jgi:hypothetical protein
MDSGMDTLAGGFPHSEICGSQLVCQLPAAFRRLPRLSSPVVAKASTVCTYSLDHITPSVLALYGAGLAGYADFTSLNKHYAYAMHQLYSRPHC